MMATTAATVMTEQRADKVDSNDVSMTTINKK